MLAQILGHRDQNDVLEYLSEVLRDVSQRKTFERSLEHGTTYDSLTGS